MSVKFQEIVFDARVDNKDVKHLFDTGSEVTLLFNKTVSRLKLNVIKRKSTNYQSKPVNCHNDQNRCFIAEGYRKVTTKQKRTYSRNCKPLILLVGMRRFELPTSCPPDKRANQAAPHPDKV